MVIFIRKCQSYSYNGLISSSPSKVLERTESKAGLDLLNEAIKNLQVLVSLLFIFFEQLLMTQILNVFENTIKFLT